MDGVYGSGAWGFEAAALTSLPELNMGFTRHIHPYWV